MAKYDIESFLADIETLLKAHLNTAISALNTEKNDSITLASVDSAAYFLQSLNGPVANFDPYILYGVTDIKSASAESASVSDLTVQVIIVQSDNGQDENISKRMYRYGRVLQETFEDHFQENSLSIKMKIQSLVPISYEQLNSSFRSRAVGVSIQAFLPS